MAYPQSMGISAKHLPTSTPIEANAKQRIAQAALAPHIPKQTRLASQHTESAPRSEQHQNAGGDSNPNCASIYLQRLRGHPRSIAEAGAARGAAVAATLPLRSDEGA